VPDISLNHGESTSLSVSSPVLHGRFIPAIDDSRFKDGLGLVIPWGGAQLSRATPNSGDVSNMVSNMFAGADYEFTGLAQEAADTFSEFLSGLSFEAPVFEGMGGGGLTVQIRGLQGPPTYDPSELSIPKTSNDLISALRRSVSTKDVNQNIYYDLGKGILKLENRTFDPPDPETGRIWIRTDL